MKGFVTDNVGEHTGQTDALFYPGTAGHVVMRKDPDIVLCPAEHLMRFTDGDRSCPVIFLSGIRVIEHRGREKHKSRSSSRNR